jgi:hypothetical protein
MSLKASSLKINSNRINILNAQINGILKTIDDEIKKAYDADLNKLSINLPITFSILNLSNQYAQRYIYYHVLKSLLRREYNVKIDVSNDKVVFHIKWINEEEEAEIKKQNALLAEHTLINR